MFCTQCSKPVPKDARFCGNCGSPTGMSNIRLVASGHHQASDMSLGKFLGLCVAAWIVGVIIANSVSILMGSAYAEATAPTIIGFWGAKAALKNKRRAWSSIIAFPVITLLAGFLGTTLGLSFASHNPESTNYSALISACVAFALSLGLFALLPKDLVPSSSAGASQVPSPPDLKNHEKNAHLISPGSTTTFAKSRRAQPSREKQERLLLLCQRLRDGDLAYDQYQVLAQAVGASIRRESFFGGKYIVTHGYKMASFNNIPSLKPWFIEHIIPDIEAKA